MEPELTKFISVYETYYGKSPEIEINPPWLRVSDLTPAFRISNIETITAYFQKQIKLYRSPYGAVSETEIEEISEAYCSGEISLSVAAGRLRVGYPAFLKYVSGHKLTFCEAVKRIQQGYPTEYIQWEDKTKTRKEWAKEIGITPSRFNARYREYGLCKKTFMTKTSLREHLSKNSNTIINCGSEAWQKLGKKRNLNKPLKKLLTPLSARKIIYTIILDAIHNVEKGNKYADESKEFLLNEDDGLLFFLDVLDDANTQYWLRMCAGAANRPVLEQSQLQQTKSVSQNRQPESRPKLRPVA